LLQPVAPAVHLRKQPGHVAVLGVQIDLQFASVFESQVTLVGEESNFLIIAPVTYDMIPAEIPSISLSLSTTQA